MTKKLGFVFDSFSSKTPEFMEENNYGYFPFRTDIDGEIFTDFGGYEQKHVLEKIKNSKVAKSSLPNLELMSEVIKQKSKEFDDVLVFCISSALSSTYQQVVKIASEYPNVYVYDNSWAGEQYFDVVDYITKYYEANNGDMKSVIKKLDEIMEKSIIYVFPPSVDYVIKGGRVSSFKKFLLRGIKLIGLNPYVKFYKNEASTGGIGRTQKGALNKMIDKMITFGSEYSKEFDPKKFKFHIFQGCNDILVENVKNILSKHNIAPKLSGFIPSAVAVHTGPEAVCITMLPDLSDWDI
ncbi:DegV family protein [Mycoplasma sp. U97]|uniref:DegV family protein n=1 Tax=Mycoplasma tauri TaxID=547987 RepID=A0A953NCT9_9MOLU|nr:DegV family protein [Mycoplasma tauri]MBZ4195507.1 DegV family protein [Mycoplasma tauri]MBZ4212492.1 DegV family protein [Mycoplasma tauri]QSB07228.1 DegV family protein [Mycoplasma tauri]